MEQAASRWTSPDAARLLRRRSLIMGPGRGIGGASPSHSVITTTTPPASDAGRDARPRLLVTHRGQRPAQRGRKNRFVPKPGRRLGARRVPPLGPGSKMIDASRLAIATAHTNARSAGRSVAWPGAVDLAASLFVARSGEATCRRTPGSVARTTTSPESRNDSVRRQAAGRAPRFAMLEACVPSNVVAVQPLGHRQRPRVCSRTSTCDIPAPISGSCSIGGRDVERHRPGEVEAYVFPKRGPTRPRLHLHELPDAPSAKSIDCLVLLVQTEAPRQCLDLDVSPPPVLSSSFRLRPSSLDVGQSSRGSPSTSDAGRGDESVTASSALGRVPHVLSARTRATKRGEDRGSRAPSA